MAGLQSKFGQCVLAVLLLLAMSGCDWSVSDYDSARGRMNPLSTRIKLDNVADLAEQWHAVGPFTSSATTANGRVYVGGGDSNLYVFDARRRPACDGTAGCPPLWRAKTAGAAVSAASVVAGVAYVTASENVLYAFDARACKAVTGNRRFASRYGPAAGGLPRSAASPAVAGGLVYATQGRGDVFAYDAAGVQNCSGLPRTCQPVWRASIPCEPFPDVSCALTAVTVARGRAVVGRAESADAIASGSTIAFDASGNTHCSGTPKICLPLWTNSGFAVDYEPASANGVVYINRWQFAISTGLAAVQAIDLVSGATRWTAPTAPAIPRGSPAVSGSMVYAMNDDTLFAFDGSMTCTLCAPAWTAAGGMGSPSVANGRVRKHDHERAGCL